MKAKIKCSHCGSEMTNMNIDWGRKQFWWTLPFMFLGFLPMIKMTFFKGDITKDLSISNVETRVVGSSLEIVGLITNNGNHEWSGITVEAEFFDSSGAFVDEASEYLRSDIRSKQEEHFKIVITEPHSQVLSSSINPKLKIAGGHSNLF